jgi:hypothetical protein
MFQGLASNATVTDRISAHNLSPSAHTPLQDKISEEITAHNTDAAAHNVDLGTPITNDAIMEGVNSTKAILTRHNNNLKYCFNSFGTKNYMHNFLIRSGDSCIAFTISTAGTAPITTANALLKTLKTCGVFELANKQITATGHIVDGGYTCAVTLAGEGRNPILSCYLIATDGGDSSVYLDFSSAIIMDTVI